MANGKGQMTRRNEKHEGLLAWMPGCPFAIWKSGSAQRAHDGPTS